MKKCIETRTEMKRVYSHTEYIRLEENRKMVISLDSFLLLANVFFYFEGFSIIEQLSLEELESLGKALGQQRRVRIHEDNFNGKNCCTYI